MTVQLLGVSSVNWRFKAANVAAAPFVTPTEAEAAQRAVKLAVAQQNWGAQAGGHLEGQHWRGFFHQISQHLE